MYRKKYRTVSPGALNQMLKNKGTCYKGDFFKTWKYSTSNESF